MALQNLEQWSKSFWDRRPIYDFGLLNTSSFGNLNSGLTNEGLGLLELFETLYARSWNFLKAF